jgi:NDP-sugar pyrophosphorylase family protein
MRAAILAGGQGTRLRPYTTIIPKPLMPLGDRPILEHIIAQLARAGVDHVDLCVSHLGGLIQTYFSDAGHIPPGLELAWHWEDVPLGTAGALQMIPDLDETFIAMNGDVLTDLDYRTLVDFHLEREAALTIATRRTTVNIDLGVIEHRGEWVTDYREKPTLSYDVSMGIHVYEPVALEYMPPGVCQFPELVLHLVHGGERVAVFLTDAAWYDIGTPGEYERAAADTRLFS